MTSSTHDTAVLSALAPLVEAGFAVHWLHPREKRPVGSDWQDAAVATLGRLRDTHRPGYNLGVRSGEPSRIGSLYLQIIDLDIRKPDLADEAWAAFATLFPTVNPQDLPSVVSGSGGESRHLYLVTDRPFFSRKLAVSEGKHRRFDKARNKDVWSRDWEIELFGTGKQAAMPPSIHPDTGEPYRWERPFDLDLIDLFPPYVPADAIAAIGAVEDATYEFETREPLTFEPGQLDRDLDALPVARLDDYHDWVTLGQALHHQFGGSDAGFDLWVSQSKRSEKFELKGMLRKWRGFGKNRRQPVTMATIRQWAQEARAERWNADAFDDLPEDDEEDDEDDVDAGVGDGFGDLFGEAGSDGPVESEEREDPFDDKPPLVSASDIPWTALFDLNEEGVIKPTLHNLELILKNDPRFVGLACLNEFTQETVQRTDPGQKANRRAKATKQVRQLAGRVWTIKDRVNGDLWSDDRDFAIRSVIEAPKTQGGYGIKVTDRDLKAAIVLASNDNPFHPIREYLNALEWDGTPRLERLFIDFVGSPDDAYHRDIGRLWMLGAVTRIFEPGHKFDFTVILEGIQGKRKSTFIETLGRTWFAELDGDFHDAKVMIEMMQGAWIMEIPELSGFARADVRAIKAFISRKKDRARLAYARRAGEFPRQCVFMGSTNDREYLKDDTGGRRFWPVMCTVSEIDIERLETLVDHLWAEAVAVYREMRRKQPRGTLPLYLRDEESRRIAAKLQESRRVESGDEGLAGRIAAWLDRPVSSGGFDEAQGRAEPRNVTCLMEIWVQALDGDIRAYDNAKAQNLGRAMGKLHNWVTNGGMNNFPAPYGRQRFYERVGTLGRNSVS